MSKSRVPISAAARRADCHPSTIRRLEVRGLISPRRDWSGRRLFSDRDIQRLLELLGRDDDAHNSDVDPDDEVLK